jgi:hypothetical protein
LRNKNNKGLLDLVCFSGRWLKRNDEQSRIILVQFNEENDWQVFGEKAKPFEIRMRWWS